MLDQARLKEVLRYVKRSGLFYWRVSFNNGVSVGDVAGVLNSKGYVLIGVDGKLYRAHRLAWLYVMGEWPSGLLDHRNCCKSDNRWTNLREATERLNRENLRSACGHSRTGLLGVTPSPTPGRWVAQIKSHRRSVYLGSFSSPEQAHWAYVKAKRSLHAGCTI